MPPTLIAILFTQISWVYFAQLWGWRGYTVLFFCDLLSIWSGIWVCTCPSFPQISKIFVASVPTCRVPHFQWDDPCCWLSGCLPTCIHFPPLLYHAKTNILASEKMAQSALGTLLFRYSFIWNHLLCLTNEVPPALHDMLEWQHCRSSLTYAKDGVSGRNQHHASHTATCRWLHIHDNQHLNARSLEQKRYC